MGSGTETTGGERGAARVYAAELGALETVQARDGRRERLLGLAKLALAAGTLIAAGLLIHDKARLEWLAAPCALFVALAVGHEKMLGAMRRRDRALRFYRRGLARLEGRWAGEGARGERFLEAAHPYARDLDIFGEQSLFEYLNAARTQTGEALLAKWLLDAAPLKEVLARQEAVRELGPMVKLRERLASSGEDVRAGVEAQALAAWGESGPVLTSLGTRAATAGFAILWLGSLAAWPLAGTPLPLLLMSIVNFAYAHRLYVRLERAAGAIEKAAAELRLLAELLALIEQEEFAAAKLKELEAAVRREGTTASRAIRRLASLAEIIESRHSLFARPLDLVLFWSAQFVFAAERWQRRYGPAIRAWLEAAGELEALASLGAFAYEHPDYAFPEFAQEAPLFDAEGLAHPLLPPGKAVGNDVRLDGYDQVMILSGPNMAGKSTFIRSVGVNAVLAQCGAPACARRLRMSPLRVAASICVLDSLSGGVSRFYGEIRRVKMIAQMAESSVPVLFLLDELLSGTNSHDRLTGTEFVLRTLAERRAIGVVSTHDLALTRIPDRMNGKAFNAHFADRLAGDALEFDYNLQPGPVTTSNALKLMRAIGLGVATVDPPPGPEPDSEDHSNR
ncbi:MAG TPA: hypothetical protein VG267_11410 [Terracidiphilus sp.]|jgi:hypothetical protein|nr:hypothetical protein [Terracidiphilus sp.]